MLYIAHDKLRSEVFLSPTGQGHLFSVLNVDTQTVFGRTKYAQKTVCVIDANVNEQGAMRSSAEVRRFVTAREHEVRSDAWTYTTTAGSQSQARGGLHTRRLYEQVLTNKGKEGNRF